jgi:hypothetical protein
VRVLAWLVSREVRRLTSRLDTSRRFASHLYYSLVEAKRERNRWQARALSAERQLREVDE